MQSVQITEDQAIELGQEIKIGGEIFRAVNIYALGVYFVKVKKNGQLASTKTPSNHGTYTISQIKNNLEIGIIELI